MRWAKIRNSDDPQLSLHSAPNLCCYCTSIALLLAWQLGKPGVGLITKLTELNAKLPPPPGIGPASCCALYSNGTKAVNDDSWTITLQTGLNIWTVIRGCSSNVWSRSLGGKTDHFKDSRENINTSILQFSHWILTQNEKGRKSDCMILEQLLI